MARNGEGLSMLVLEGSDPVQEKTAFDTDGSGGFEIFDFARQARRPDGQEVEVGFRLAFARDPGSPDIGAFTSTQLNPENFWSPDLQRHSNQATGVAGVVLVADAPAEHQAFLETLTGCEVQRALDAWYVAQTPRGSIDVMSRQLFTDRYGVPAPGGQGLRLAAVRFATPGAPELRRSRRAAHGGRGHRGHRCGAPRAALGATLVFELTPG